VQSRFSWGKAALIPAASVDTYSRNAPTIEDPAVLAELERRVASTGKSANQVVADALNVQLTSTALGPLSEEQRKLASEAFHELREWYQKHRDPNDLRTDDEVIGYNVSAGQAGG
jgi:hypothetical protein